MPPDGVMLPPVPAPPPGIALLPPLPPVEGAVPLAPGVALEPALDVMPALDVVPAVAPGEGTPWVSPAEQAPAAASKVTTDADSRK